MPLFTLAILVNVIELLCTAGLPALYANILMQQGLSSAGRYAYLGLYIVAYMFDDTQHATDIPSVHPRRFTESQQSVVGGIPKFQSQTANDV